MVFLALAAPAQEPPPTDYATLGVQVERIEPRGVRITYVYPGSAALAMGARAGDEVVELNGAEVQDPDSFARGLRRREVGIGSPVRLLIRRGPETVELKGEMGSWRATRQAFTGSCRRELVGKPFLPAANLAWPDGQDGLMALRGKVGVVVCFDECRDCVDGKWKVIREMRAALERTSGVPEWLGFAGIYSRVDLTKEENRAARAKLMRKHPGSFPVGLWAYPGDRIPLDSAGREPLVHVHGVALLDPEGKLLHLDLGNPGEEFLKAFQAAQEQHGKKYGAKDGAKDWPKRKENGSAR